MSRLVYLPMILSFVVVLAACAAVTDEPNRPIPAGAVQIRVYTEGGEGGNGVPETIRWAFQSVGALGEWGVVSPIPEATCIAVGSRWRLSIDDNGRNVPLDRFRHTDFSGASPLDLRIVRDQAGRFAVTEELPEWMDGKPLGCAPVPPR